MFSIKLSGFHSRPWLSPRILVLPFSTEPQNGSCDHTSILCGLSSSETRSTRRPPSCLHCRRCWWSVRIVLKDCFDFAKVDRHRNSRLRQLIPLPHPVPPPRHFVTSPQSPICHQYKMAPVNTVHRTDWDRQLRKLKIILSLYHKENMTAPPISWWIDTCCLRFRHQQVLPHPPGCLCFLFYQVSRPYALIIPRSAEVWQQL